LSCSADVHRKGAISALISKPLRFLKPRLLHKSEWTDALPGNLPSLSSNGLTANGQDAPSLFDIFDSLGVDFLA